MAKRVSPVPLESPQAGNDIRSRGRVVSGSGTHCPIYRWSHRQTAIHGAASIFLKQTDARFRLRFRAAIEGVVAQAPTREGASKNSDLAIQRRVDRGPTHGVERFVDVLERRSAPLARRRIVFLMFDVNPGAAQQVYHLAEAVCARQVCVDGRVVHQVFAVERMSGWGRSLRPVLASASSMGAGDS